MWRRRRGSSKSNMDGEAKTILTTTRIHTPLLSKNFYISHPTETYIYMRCQTHVHMTSHLCLFFRVNSIHKCTFWPFAPAKPKDGSLLSLGVCLPDNRQTIAVHHVVGSEVSIPSNTVALVVEPRQYLVQKGLLLVVRAIGLELG